MIDFSEHSGLFRFVSKQFCLFRLFRYRFETPKQTEKKKFWFHETNRNKPKQTRNRSCFGLFRFELKFFFFFISRTPYLRGYKKPAMKNNICQQHIRSRDVWQYPITGLNCKLMSAQLLSKNHVKCQNTKTKVS